MVWFDLGCVPCVCVWGMGWVNVFEEWRLADSPLF